MKTLFIIGCILFLTSQYPRNVSNGKGYKNVDFANNKTKLNQRIKRSIIKKQSKERIQLKGPSKKLSMTKNKDSQIQKNKKTKSKEIKKQKRNKGKINLLNGKDKGKEAIRNWERKKNEINDLGRKNGNYKKQTKQRKLQKGKQLKRTREWKGKSLSRMSKHKNNKNQKEKEKQRKDNTIPIKRKSASRNVFTGHHCEYIDLSMMKTKSADGCHAGMKFVIKVRITILYFSKFSLIIFGVNLKELWVNILDKTLFCNKLNNQKILSYPRNTATFIDKKS